MQEEGKSECVCDAKKKLLCQEFGVRFKYSSRLQPKYHTKDSKCHTKAQSLPNLAMCMPLVDQEEVQPVSLPDFKVNDPLMVRDWAGDSGAPGSEDMV